MRSSAERLRSNVCAGLAPILLGLAVLGLPLLGHPHEGSAQTESLARAGVWHPSSGPSCNGWPEPVRLPAAAELLDSAALNGILVADSILADRTLARGRTLLALRWDSAGQLAEVRVLETDFTAHAANRLARTVANLLRVQPAGSTWALRLGVELGDAGGVAPRLTVSRSAYCPPGLPVEPVAVTELERIWRLRGREWAAERVEGGVPDDTLRTQSRSEHVVAIAAQWELQVDAMGRVRRAMLLNSTGHPELEQAGRESLLRLHLRPALLEGEPAAVTETITYPVTGQVSSRP